jgi:predicted CXXCH cytochrome family protein
MIWPGRAAIFSAMAMSMAMVSLVLLAADAAAEQPASGEGAAACLACHESQKVMGIIDTPHANFDDPRTPAAREQCESCHGPSATHMQFPMHAGNIVFTRHGKTPVAKRNQACLACHEEGSPAHWEEGPHGATLACDSCHEVHQRKDPTLDEAKQAARCGSCHDQILTTAPAAAPHPLAGENAMRCTQCHDPHGPTSLASCSSCHLQDASARARQTDKAREYHERAFAQSIACTACHKGFVHAMPQFSRAAGAGD